MDYQGAEVFAQANGLIQITLALLLGQHRSLQRGWGLGWLSISMGAAGLLNLTAPWLITPTLTSALKPSVAFVAQIILGVGCLAALLTGLFTFCEKKVARPTRLFGAIFMGLPTAYAMSAAMGFQFGGEWVTFGLMIWCAFIAWQAEKVYPKTGHRQLFVVLVMYPITLSWFHFSGTALPLSRYVAAGPFTLIGVVLLSVTLNRLRLLRERALDDLHQANLNLEVKVAQRTAELASRNADLQRSIEKVNANEMRAKESQARLQEILDASGEGIWDWNVTTGVLLNNRRWDEMMGFSDVNQTRTIGVFQQLLPNHERARVEGAIERTLQGLEPYHLEHQMRRVDGTIFWVLDKGDVVERDATGTPMRMVGTVSDITEHKRAHDELVRAHEELSRTKDLIVQSEKMASLGALVAGVSHELNTPLGNAVTAASTLQDERKQFAKKVESGLTRSSLNSFMQTVHAAGDLIERNLERANDLVHSFKQVAVDQSTFNRRIFDLQEVVNEIVVTMGPTIKRSPVSLSVDIHPGLSMDSFPGPVGQVLMNFISNALIHGLEGTKNGVITIKATVDAPGWLSLSVADNGRGIPPEIQPKIFDPFFTTRLGKGGSGLGLNIVFNVVTGLLGGTVVVKSALGQGAEFKLRLPMVAPAVNDRVTHKEIRA